MKKLLLPLAAAAALAIAACGPGGQTDETPGDVFPGFTEPPTPTEPVDPLGTPDDDDMETDDAMDKDDAMETPAY